MANERGGIPIGQWSGSDATDDLHKTVLEFVAKSETQTTQMIRLTWAIVILTIVMALGLAAQIYLQIRSDLPREATNVSSGELPIVPGHVSEKLHAEDLPPNITMESDA